MESTKDVNPCDRLDRLLDVGCKTCVDPDLRPDLDDEMCATIEAGSLAQLGLAIIECSPLQVLRGQCEIARSGCDDILICLQLSGSTHVTQGDRDAQLQTGQFMLFDTKYPFTIKPGPNYRLLTVIVPRHLLEVRLGSIVQYSVRPMTQDNAVGRLTFDFIRMLPSQADRLDDIAAQKVAEQTLDFLALSFTGGTPNTQSSARVLALSRLKSSIEAHLSDSSLTLAQFAENAGMSVRYANRLLEAENTSLARYVYQRRLARSRSVLASVDGASQSISEVAAAHGFCSASHFTEKFKQMFGMTPSEYRQSLQHDAQPVAS